MFRPNQIFDDLKHSVDFLATSYLQKANADVHHLIPIESVADGNCLYNSILILMDNSIVTVSELRGRSIQTRFFSFKAKFEKHI